MRIVTFNAEEIEIDAIQAVDTMAFTYAEFQRIQNDTEEVVRKSNWEQIMPPKMDPIHITNLKRKIE